MWTPYAIRMLLLLLGVVAISAQSDGRYSPPRPTTTRGRAGDGRYNPAAAGRYNPAGAGRYNPNNDGRYVPQNDGQYVHTDAGYTPDDRSGGGAYSGGTDRYKPDLFRGFGGGASAGGGTGRGESASAGGGTGRGIGGSASASAGGGAATNIGAGRGTAAGVGGAAFRPRPAVAALDPIGSTLPQGRGTAEGGNNWKIIRLEFQDEQDGYHYLYETENGILAEESGRIEQLSPDSEGLRSQGFFEYTGDDGKLYRVDYVADDNGFVPRGDHIPAEPPHIAKLLVYLKEHDEYK